MSDRKETYDLTHENEVTKWLRSENDDFFISLAGINDLPKVLLNSLASSHINSQNIKNEIEKISAEYYSNATPQTRGAAVKGFLATKRGDRFELKILEINGQICTISDNDALVFFIGSEEASLFAKHFLRDQNLQNMTCEIASKYIVAAMEELSKTVKTVGDQSYGYDIAKFSNSEITQRLRFTDLDIASLNIGFTIDNDKNVFQDSMNNGGRQ